MPLALGATAIVLLTLLWQLTLPRLREALSRRSAPAGPRGEVGYDPGRELRAEQRARALLRSCVNEEEWAMYRDLGFLRVWGGLAPAWRPPRDSPEREEGIQTAATGAPYAYLIYPHKPLLAYLPQTGALLGEYCVSFPDHNRPYGCSRLPDSDDVLAKWMALTADERRLIADANMHLPGRQIDSDQARRDLERLARWESQPLGRAAQASVA